MLNLAQNTPAAGSAPAIFEANAMNFQQEVLMGSMQRPVLAYFTASWCGPCKQLRPVLEKVVNGLGGKVGLAVIDIDQNPDLAGAMRVQSVPQVYAFVQSQPVDGFMGVQPESKLKEFMQKLLAMMGQADDAQEQGDSADPMLAARRQWEDGNLAGAISVYMELSADEKLAPHAKKSADFLKQLLPHAAPDAMTKAVNAAKDKTAASMHQLAFVQLAAGELVNGLESLLASIRVDRSCEKGRAREDFVALSEIIGIEDPIIINARRSLSSILFS